MHLRFGPLTFDRETRRLRRGELEVHLSPKAFDLLALLIDRRPQAVSKAEIRAHIWPGTFVSETNLPSLVAEIRDALGERASDARLVRTVHKFGYAFEGDAAPERAEDSPPRAWLVGSDARLALYAGENILGREGTGVVILSSSTVSRRHARVIVGGHRTTLEDLGSKNGTFLNDEPVTSPVLLHEGDRVRLGSLVRTFSTRRSRSSVETGTQTSSAETPRV
ncbi:MAG: FHA domain-containing protein [Acidobacteriota bacterium]